MPEREPTQMILGESIAIANLREQIRRLAVFDAVGSQHVPTVLLQGETGTGKGLIARSLHESGPRSRNPFIDVNCAAIPDTMLEAELFGFEAGAFTDARRAKPGLFEAASSGTLFLDEIDSLSLVLQAKLVKAIEEKSIRRLGAVGARQVDVKLIAATQRELEPLVADGRFRADLYHRLAVLVLYLPPLRARGDDAILLAEHLLADLANAHGLAPRRLGSDAQRWLHEYAWPGNVRELSHLIERVILLGPEGEIDAATLDTLCAPQAPARGPAGDAPAMRVLPESSSKVSTPPSETERAEAERIMGALTRAGGNVVGAARMLGIGRNALRYRMRRLGIQKPSLDDLSYGEGSVSARPVDPPASSLAPSPPADTGQPVSGESAGWEHKRAATLTIDLFFREPTDGAPLYEPWTQAERWKQAISERLRGFGGVVLDRTTSRCTAAFGIPRALEQTSERAVQAALALQHLAANAAGPRPELRIAVHLGEVRFDASTADLRVLALGDTFALPERLIGHAGAGEILVSARIARQVAQRWTLEPRSIRLGPSTQDAVLAYAVVSAQPQRAATRQTEDGTTSTFVGRERELAILDESFRSADAGQGQVVFVTGEAGLGKSRLLLELRQRLRDGDSLWVEGHCASYGTTTPFLPIVDGLRRVLGIDDRDDDASAGAKIAAAVESFSGGDDLRWTLPFVRQVLSLPASASSTADGPRADAGAIAGLDSASRRSETFRALRALLLRAAEQRCVVLVVEDLHWIDHASEEFLAFVTDFLPTLRVLLICSHRPGYAQPFGDRSYYLRLTLRPLSTSEMADMTRSLLQTSEMPAAVRDLIAEKAEGNPFFIEEVTRSLVEDGSLHRDNGTVRLTRNLDEITIPDTIQDVLTARIDRLADEARSAIQVASVIGREFALRLLERITDAGERVRGQLNELRSLELIYEKALHPELAYMFKHALTHDVAYRSVMAERRSALHRTIGLAIEELYADRLEEHYETLALHFARAHDWPRAFTYHDRAAEKAAKQHATQAVVEHSKRALEIADRLGDGAPAEVRCAIEARLGLACFYLSDFAASAQAFERAASAAGEPSQSALLLTFAAQSHFWAHDYGKARAATSAVLEKSDAESGPAARAMALNVRGFTCAVLDADFGEADRHYGDAMRLVAGRVADIEASIRFNQTLFAEWTGDYSRAIELAERVMATGKELRLAHLVVWPYWFLGKARCCLGDFGGALAQLEEGFQICDRIGDRAWKCRLLNTLGWCLAEIGSHERSREFNLRAAELARQIGDPEIVANSEINLALDHLALGRPEEAWAFLEPIEAVLSRPGDPWMRWRYALHALHARGQIDLALGEPERVLACAEREIAGAVLHRAPKLEARGLATAGQALLALERWEEAAERITGSLRVAERIRAPRAAWRAHGLLAELERIRGRREQQERHARKRSELVDSAARSLRDTELRRHLIAAGQWPR